MGVRIQELPETTGIKKEDVLIVEDGQGTKKGTVQQLDETLGVSQLKEDIDDIKGIKLYNIISKVNKTENMYIDGGSGELLTNNDFDVSDFIEIQPYCTYYGSTPNLTYHFGAVYDGTKTLIGTIFNLSKINKDTSTFEFIAPKNAKYIRFSLSKADSSNYVCYEKNRFFTNVGVSDEMLENGLINLCKIDSNPSNGYIDNEGKYVYSDQSYKVVATDFIEIQPNTTYYGYNENSEHIPEPNYQGAIYDENKELISSIYNLVGAKSNYSFKAPSNAKYVRLTIFYNSNQYFYKKHNLDSFETSEFNKPEEKINIMYKTQIRKPLIFNEKTCVFCGDSITAGSTSSSTETENNFPKLFCQAVNSTMINLAVGGSTLSKVDGYGCIFDQIKNNENKNCEFLFVCGGINDWQLGVQLDAFKQTMKDICDYINANYSNSTKVIFITPINEGGWAPIKTPVATIQDYRNIISMSIIENDTYSRFSLIQGTDFNFPTKDDNAEFIDIAYGDKLHPSELGYKNIYTVGLLNTLL